MVYPDRPWPRPETPRPPLDSTASATLELWCAQPEWDMRSLEEFAADGGRPVGPPNQLERTGWSWPDWLEALGRGILGFFENFVPVPPSIPPRPTILPPAPPPKNFETGHLRSSLGGAGGVGRVELMPPGLIIVSAGTTLYRGRPMTEADIERIMCEGGETPPPDSGGVIRR